MTDRQRLIDVALSNLGNGMTKQFTIGQMRLINSKLEKSFLIRELSPIFDEAKKQFELSSNKNLGAMAEDAGAGGALDATDASKVTEVIGLARELYSLKCKIDEVNEELKPLQERFKKIGTDELPGAMQAAGVGDRFPLANGWCIERRTLTNANLPSPQAIAKEKDPVRREELKQRLNDGLAFLTKTGNEGIIKEMIQVILGKGETNRAKGVENFLRKRDINFFRNRSVHAQTLNAWVREQINLGNELPAEVFGVHTVTTVKLVEPKKD